VKEENGGIKMTTLAPSFLVFISGLEYREENCLVIALKSKIEKATLQGTIVDKLREAEIEVKTGDEFRKACLESFSPSDDEDDEDFVGEVFDPALFGEGDSEDDDFDNAGNPREIGALTNQVRDIGGDSSSDDTGDLGDGGDGLENAPGGGAEALGPRDGDDGNGDDDDSDENTDELDLLENIFGQDDHDGDFEADDSQCVLDALDIKHFPKQVASGYNFYFSYAVLNSTPKTENLGEQIKKVLQSIEGVDADIEILCEPLDPSFIIYHA